jgi:hypothetical protein
MATMTAVLAMTVATETARAAMPESKATMTETAMTEEVMAKAVITEIVVRAFVIWRTLHARRIGWVVGDGSHAFCELRRHLMRSYPRTSGVSWRRGSATATTPTENTAIERGRDRLVTLDEVIDSESCATESKDPVCGMELLQFLDDLHQLSTFSHGGNGRPSNARTFFKLLFEFLRHMSFYLSVGRPRIRDRGSVKRMRSEKTGPVLYVSKE